MTTSRLRRKAAADSAQGKEQPKRKRKPRPKDLNRTEEFIWDLLDKAKSAPVEEGCVGDWFCLPAAPLHQNAKIYEKCQRYLPTCLNLPATEVIDQLFTSSSSKQQIKKADRLLHFIDSFGLQEKQVALKYADTLVFFVLQEGSVAQTQYHKDDANLEIPRWARQPAQTFKRSNPAASTSRSDPPPPPSPSSRPSASKKQRQMASKPKSQHAKCHEALAGGLSEASMKDAKNIVSAMQCLIDGEDPKGAVSHGKKAVSLLPAATAFLACATAVDPVDLGGVLVDLWNWHRQAGKTTASQSETDVPQPRPTQGTANPLLPPIDLTVDDIAAPAIIDLNADMESDVGAVSEAAVQVVDDCFRRRMKACKKGEAVKLTFAEEKMLGRMIAAATRNAFDTNDACPFIKVRDAHLNHLPVSVITLPPKNDGGSLPPGPGQKAKGDSQRYRNWAGTLISNVSCDARLALQHSLCRQEPDIVKTKVVEFDLDKFKLNDRQSNIISVGAQLSKTQEENLNRLHASFCHGKRVTTDRKRRDAERRAKKKIKTAQYPKLKLEEKVTKGNKTIIIDKRQRCYLSSAFEHAVNQYAELEQSGQIVCSTERFDREDWDDTLVLCIKVDKGQGSTKMILNFCNVKDPQNTRHARQVAYFAAAKDSYENLRRVFFNSDGALKHEIEDLLNEKSAIITARVGDNKGHAVARHSGETSRDETTLPVPTRTGTAAFATAPEALPSDEDDAEKTFEFLSEARFDFDLADKAKYMLKDQCLIVGIAYYNRNGTVIGRVYFNRQVVLPERRSRLVDLSMKKLLGVLSADYEVLGNVFGSVGAKSIRPCVWCELEKKYFFLNHQELQEKAETDRQTRTRATISANYEMFQQKLSEQTKKLSNPKDQHKFELSVSRDFSCSIIRRPLLSIDPSSCICMPLHIILGLTNQIDSLTKRCIEIVDSMGTDGRDLQSRYALKRERNRLLRVICQLKHELLASIEVAQAQAEIGNLLEGEEEIDADQIYALIERVDNHQNVVDDDDVAEKSAKLRACIENLNEVDVWLDSLVGKGEREYFEAKKANGIDETVYHGDAVGPDCIKMGEKYEAIFDQLIAVYDGDGGNAEQKDAVRALVERMKEMWKDWSVLMKHMKRTNRPLQENEIADIRTLSQAMHSHIRRFVDDPPVPVPNLKFPEMIKLHCLLVEHLHEVAARFHTIGVLSEESIESIHQIWNRFGRRFACMRGERKDKSMNDALTFFQDSDIIKGIEDALAKTARFSEEQKEEMRQRREAKRREAEAAAVAIDNNAANGDGDDGEDDNQQLGLIAIDQEEIDATEIDIVLCPDCYCECSSSFLPFHRQHKHSGQSLSNDRREKRSI